MCKYRTYRAAMIGPDAMVKRFNGGKVIRGGEA